MPFLADIYQRILNESADASTAITINTLRKEDGKSLGIELAEEGKYSVINMESSSGDTGWTLTEFENVWYAMDMMGEPRSKTTDIDALLDALEKERVKNPDEFMQ